MTSLVPLSFASSTLVAQEVSAGQYSTCVLFTNKLFLCFGSGFPYAPSYLPPTNIIPFYNTAAIPVKQVVALDYANCVLIDGTDQVSCWGSNNYGELGGGSTASTTSLYRSPLIIFDQSTITVTRIDGGGSTMCALFINQRVRCWGYNGGGPLGQGHTRNVGTAPSDMTSIPFISFSDPNALVSYISVGGYHACALFSSPAGRIICWGYGGNGQLGTGNTLNMGSSPSDMTSLPFITFSSSDLATGVSAGGIHTCAIFAQGGLTKRLRCWGESHGAGSVGNIGDNPTEMSALAYLSFSDSLQVVQVSAGKYHTCATFANDRLRCWGEGVLGYDSYNIPGNFYYLFTLPYISMMPSVLTSLTPVATPVVGGALLAIAGLNFISPTVTVRFAKPPGGTCPSSPIDVTGVVPSSEFLIPVATPAWPCGASSSEVSVSLDGGLNFTLSAPFIFYTPFSLTSLAPASPKGGPKSGATAITMVGTNLISTLSALCRLGNYTSELTVINSTLCTCNTPVVPTSQNASLEIALNGVDFTTSGLIYYYYDVTALSLDLVRGPANGGTPIYIRMTATGTVNHPGHLAIVKLSTIGTNSSGSTVILTAPGTVVTDLSAPSGLSVLFTTPNVNPYGLLFPASFVFTISLNNGHQYLQPVSPAFEYVADPSVISVTPIGIPVGTSATITIKGSNFIDRPSLCTLFGLVTNVTVPGTFQPSTSYIIAMLPAMTAQTATVEITLNDKRQYTTNGVTLSIYSLVSALPPGGPTGGSTAVTVTGTGFTSVTLSCKFGGMPATTATRLSSTQIACPAPASSSATTVPLEVSLDGTLYSSSGTVLYQYYVPPTVTAISPRSGPTSLTASAITLFGTFAVLPALSAKCRIGTIITTATSATTGTIICPLSTSASSVASGDNLVSLALNGVDYIISNLYYSAFEALAVNPTIGPTTGSTEIIVSGIGFSILSGTWTCRFFGTTVTTPARVISSGQISCSTPPSISATTTTVDISSNGVLYTASATAKFTYHAAPTIVSLTPSSGKSTGGTVVTISGTNLSPLSTYSISCKFGPSSVPVTATNIPGSTTSILCTTPPGSGSVSLSVSLNAVDYSVSTARFSYFTLDTIDPLLGPVTGGTLVTLTGSGFTDTPSCLFGTVAGTVVQRLDTTRIVCKAPRAATFTTRSTVTISISMNTVEYVGTTTLSPYVYHLPSNITAFMPTSGPTGGNTTVTLLGAFALEPNHTQALVQCIFDTVPVSSTFASTSAITCVTPLGAGIVSTRLTLNGQVKDAVEAPTRFSFFKLTSLTPSRGPLTGGTIITASGDGFVRTSALWCVFEGGSTRTLLPATRLDDQTVTCTAPVDINKLRFAAFAALASNSSSLAVANIAITSDKSSFTDTQPFTLYPPATITSFVPSTLPSGGGVVTITGFNFIPGSTTCRFGNSSQGDGLVTFANATVLICVAPPTAKSVVPVSVSMNSQQFHVALGANMSFTACDKGSFAERDQDACQKCPVGSYSDQEGARACIVCLSSGFADQPGHTNCTRCPDNSVTRSAPSSITACECKDGFFHRQGRTGEPCEPCPEGGVCTGGTAAATPKFGHWASKNDPFTFLPCTPASSCPGFGVQKCAEGFTGRMCAKCQPGWFRTGTDCKPCPKASALIIVAFVVFAFLVAGLLVRSANKKKDPSGSYAGTVSIAIKFFQVLAVIGKLDVAWPSSVKDTISVVTTPFTLNFTDTLAPECSAPTVTYTAKWVMTMLLPFFFAVIFGLIYLGFAVVARARPTLGISLSSVTNRIINAYLSLMSLGFLTLALTAMEPFGCKQEKDGSYTLVADPALECFAPWWKRLAGPAAVAILLYVILFPLTLLWWLRRNRSNLTHPDFAERYGSLYTVYVPSLAFWEPIVMLEKVGIAACGLFFNSFVMFQVVALQMIFMVTVSVYQAQRPYVRSEDNRLHAILRWCSLVVLFAGIMFKNGTFPAEWARRSVEVLALVFIIAGTAVILGSVGFNLVKLRKALKVIVDPDLLEQMNLFSVHGRLVIVRWLRKTRMTNASTTGVSSTLWQSMLAGTLTKIHRHRDKYTGHRHDPLSDTVVTAFTRGVFRDDVVPTVREWLEDETTDPTDRSRFIDCFTSLGIVDATAKGSRDALIRLTRAAVHRNLDESLRHDPSIEPHPLELLRMLYGDQLPAKPDPLLAADPAYLASLHSLFVIAKSKGARDGGSGGSGGSGGGVDYGGGGGGSNDGRGLPGLVPSGDPRGDPSGDPRDEPGGDPLNPSVTPVDVEVEVDEQDEPDGLIDEEQEEDVEVVIVEDDTESRGGDEMQN